MHMQINILWEGIKATAKPGQKVEKVELHILFCNVSKAIEDILTSLHSYYVWPIQ